MGNSGTKSTPPVSAAHDQAKQQIDSLLDAFMGITSVQNTDSVEEFRISAESLVSAPSPLPESLQQQFEKHIAQCFATANKVKEMVKEDSRADAIESVCKLQQSLQKLNSQLTLDEKQALVQYANQKANSTKEMIQQTVTPIYSTLEKLMHSSSKVTNTPFDMGIFQESLEMALYAEDDLFKEYTTECLKKAQEWKISKPNNASEQIQPNGKEFESVCLQTEQLRKVFGKQQTFNRMNREDLIFGFVREHAQQHFKYE